MTGGEQEKGKKKTGRESNPTPPPPPLHRNRTWLRGRGGFAAPLRAVSVRVNTQRVNACLLMMLDVITSGFTSNYMNKQRGESFKSGLLVLLNPPNLGRGDFQQNASRSTEIQIGRHSYQIF